MPRINGLKEGSYFMQAPQLYRLLADRGFMQGSHRWPSKLVNEGGSCGINGVRIVIRSKAEAQALALANRQPFVHRVLAECDCGRLIPFGKLGQHRKSCSANVFGE